MVLETWWVAVNPAPDVAGLHYCLDELLRLEGNPPEDAARWQALRNELPPIPLRKIEGRTAIAPAERYSVKKNAENGSLYPVFPFQCFSLGKGTQEIVAWTMEHRLNKNAFNYRCWTQDQIHWAYAGNAEAARDGLAHRFRNASTQCPLPALWQCRAGLLPGF